MSHDVDGNHLQHYKKRTYRHPIAIERCAAMEKPIKRRNATEPCSNIIIDDDEEVHPPRTPPTPPSNVMSGGAGGNPALVILRKLARMTGSTMANFAIGFLIGVLFILLILFLDHHDFIKLGFSRALSEFMAEPENVAAIEESMDIKLISLDEYSALLEEISRTLEDVQNKTLSKREGDLEAKWMEFDKAKMQYEERMALANPWLRLDLWCGRCRGQNWRCESRIQYMNTRYNLPYVRSKVDLMQGGDCLLPYSVRNQSPRGYIEDVPWRQRPAGPEKNRLVD